MTTHSMNVYLDDVAFEELKIIEGKMYKDKTRAVQNRSGVFTKLIHEYLENKR